MNNYSINQNTKVYIPTTQQTFSPQKSDKKPDIEEEKVRTVALPSLATPPISEKSLPEQIFLKKEIPSADELENARKYGNKAANLLKLRSICESLREERINVEIPEFQALSHDTVLEYLEIIYPKFQKHWAEFVSLQKKAKDKGIEGLSPKAKAQLDKIQENIQDAFSSKKKLKMIEEHIKTFLDKADGLIMVRSTGREDSDELALAGGNESVAGVARDTKAVLHAMGTVVASYFSEQSFTQRILAHQDITQDPFMPVLLQTMIGEKPDTEKPADEILCCGVGYTRELGGETPDLTVIEAAYGHNEGVVNSLIPTDTYYIYSDGMSHEIIPPKPERLVAHPTSTGKANFVMVDNPSEIARKPALNSERQQQLQIICKSIHDTYGKPMDIEWLYDPAKKTFYIVQARPLVKRQTSDVSLKPSITDESYLQKKGTIYSGEMIVHHIGETVVLTKPEEVIVSTDLNKALQIYLQKERECKLTATKNPVKAIVVEKMGSALSHPACVFRENDIPVICSKGFENSNLKKGTIGLVDAQRGFVAQLSDPTFEKQSSAEVQKELLNKEIIKEGWFKHPLPAIESLKDVEISADYLKELYDSLELKDYTASYKNNIKNFSLTALMDAMTSGNIEKGDQAVKDLIVLLYSVVSSLSQDKHLGSNLLLTRTKSILLNAMIIGKDYLKRSDPMQRLHAAKRLEAVLEQEASLRVLNSDSLRAILEEKKGSKAIDLPQTKLDSFTLKILKHLEKYYLTRLEKGTQENKTTLIENLSSPMTENELYTCLMTYNTVKVLAFSKEAQENWKSFTDSIISSHSRIANRLLLQVIQDVENLGILGEWINDQFLASYQKEKDPILLLNMLVLDIKSVRDFQNELISFNKDVEFWNNNMRVFEDPSTFDQKFEKLGLEVVQKLFQLSQKFPKLNLNPFQKRIFLQSILKGVDVYDKCIKTMRGAPSANITQKVEHFKTMLEPYAILMNMWLNAIPEGTFNSWYRNIAETNNQDLEEYREKIVNTLMDALDEIEDDSEAQLLPRDDFNVQAKCVNSGVLFDFEDQDYTLEELFQIYHQNTLAGIASNKESIPNERLPQTLQPLLETIEGLHQEISYGEGQFLIQAEKLNQEIHFPLITITYNIPVKYHSVVIQITYDCVKQEANLQFNMLGHNLNNRMDINARSIWIQSTLQKLPFKDFPAYDPISHTLNFSWQFSEKMLQNPLDGVKNILFKAIDDSLKGNFGSISIPNLKEMEKLQPEIWDYICNNPQGLLVMLKHFYNEGKSFEMVMYMIQNTPDKVGPLLSQLGVPFAETDEKDFFKPLSKGLVDYISRDKSNARLDIARIQYGNGIVYSKKNPVNAARRIIIELVKSPNNNIQLTQEFWKDVLENKEALLYNPLDKIEDRAFYPLLINHLVDYLINTKNYDELLACAKFLMENQQLEGLVTIYYAIESLEKTDEKFAMQANEILHLIQANAVTAAPSTKDAFKQAHEIRSINQAEFDDKVIITDTILNDKYFYGRVKEVILDKKKTGIGSIVVLFGKDGLEEIVLPIDHVRLLKPKPTTGITATLNEDLEKTAHKISFEKKKK